MVKVKTLFFGVVKDIAGSDEQVFDLREQSTIADLEAMLITSYRDFKNVKQLAYAVNEEYVQSDHLLKENDLVAILPPVSGG